ncbi:hypothetical protein RM844_11400 [Streptomyces sp. DSM 44915]|uniref:DUF7848 domain-containing protein n=1 Tax=Streptomyces chisholmiae TaxID=3075540 RepID=A0ABU2JPH4_9ACTN|nr:hypothetical protein [Streptomyces sp. DSM 44915]MDT0266897.1 hypothetical protein [Streptomyces sp. DSM 44915]
MSDAQPVSIVRGADWVVCAERGVGVPEGIFGAVCQSCGVESPLFDDDSLPVAVWVLHHTAGEPEHTRFLFREEKHWRVVRRPEVGEGGGGGGRASPVAGFLDRAAGPAFVGLMCLLTALSGLLPALTTNHP